MTPALKNKQSMQFDLKTKNEEDEVEEYQEMSLSYSEEIEYTGSFHQWIAKEHEPYTVGKKFYFFSTIFLAAIVIYALVANSPIMAITFILIGIVGYIFLKKEPRTISFSITHEGIIAGNEIYYFENLKSFWIFYNPPYEKIISLRSKSNLTPHIHIPISEEDPVKLRSILINFIPEIQQEHTLVDAFENMLHR